MAWWGVASSAAAPVLLIGGWTLAAALQRAGFDPVEGTISALAARDADSRWVMTAALAGVGACHLTTAAALRSAAPAGRAVLAAGGVGSLLVAAFPLPTGGGTSATHTAAAGLAFGALSTWPLLALRRRPAPTATPAAPAAPAAPAGAAAPAAPAGAAAPAAPAVPAAPAAPADAADAAAPADAADADPAGAAGPGGGAASVAPDADHGGGADVPVALRPVVAGVAGATLLGLLGWFVAELTTDGDAVGRTERLAAAAQSLWPLAATLSAVAVRTTTADAERKPKP